MSKLTVDELEAQLVEEPWLAAYLTPGDRDIDDARRRYELDQLVAAKALRSAGVHVTERYRRGDLLTTSLDRTEALT